MRIVSHNYEDRSKTVCISRDTYPRGLIARLPVAYQHPGGRCSEQGTGSQGGANPQSARDADSTKVRVSRWLTGMPQDGSVVAQHARCCPSTEQVLHRLLLAPARSAIFRIAMPRRCVASGLRGDGTTAGGLREGSAEATGQCSVRRYPQTRAHPSNLLGQLLQALTVLLMPISMSRAPRALYQSNRQDLATPTIGRL